MGAILEFLPFPKLSQPKRVIIVNRRLNFIYYLAHIPILVYAVVFFIINMAYTEEVPNSPFTLIELDPVNALPFVDYDLNDEPSKQVKEFCEDADAGVLALDCSLEDDMATCKEMFGSLLLSPFTLKVDFFCTRMCMAAFNGRDATCFIPPTALRVEDSQLVDLHVGTTSESSGVANPGAAPVMQTSHKTNPMIRDAVLGFKYSFQLTQPAPFLLGLEDPGDRKSNDNAMTILVDSQDVVKRLYSPGEEINITVAEIVEVAGAQWNYSMVFRGSEFIVTTNCFTAQRDLPPMLYWAEIPQVYPREDLPLCILTFSWLSQSSVRYSLAGGFGRDVRIRISAKRGSSFSRLPSIQFSLLNLVSLAVLLAIPSALTGFLARTCLGPLSKIYRQATEEKFDLPMQLATAGLNSIANVATFGSLASTTLSKEELKVCLKDTLATSKRQLEDRDLDRLTNFVFEKDPRYPRGARQKDTDIAEAYGQEDKIGEPRVDAARFAISTSFRDPINMEDIQMLFDNHRDRTILERIFTPTAIQKALKDQRGLDLPAWKKELFGHTDEKEEEEILGQDMQIKVRSETTEVPREAEEASAASVEEEVRPEAVHTSTVPSTSQSGHRASVSSEDSLLIQNLRDHVDDMKFKQDAQDRRLKQLETHNGTLRAENEDLKLEMAELKEKQAQLTSRCDRQLASIQELTRTLRAFNAQHSQDLGAENSMPSSCFKAATSFQRSSA